MPPAIPPGPPDDGTSPPLAPVTDLAARRTRHDPPPPTGLTPDESLKQAADHWEGIFADAGMDLRTPAAELLPVVAAELERLVGGLLYVRAGAGHGTPRRIPRRVLI